MCFCLDGVYQWPSQELPPCTVPVTRENRNSARRAICYFCKYSLALPQSFGAAATECHRLCNLEAAEFTAYSFRARQFEMEAVVKYCGAGLGSWLLDCPSSVSCNVSGLPSKSHSPGLPLIPQRLYCTPNTITLGIRISDYEFIGAQISNNSITFWPLPSAEHCISALLWLLALIVSPSDMHYFWDQSSVCYPIWFTCVRNRAKV